MKIIKMRIKLGILKTYVFSMVDFWVVHSIRAESSTLDIKYAKIYAYTDGYVAEKYLDQRIVRGMMVLPEQYSQSNETIH